MNFCARMIGNVLIAVILLFVKIIYDTKINFTELLFILLFIGVAIILIKSMAHFFDIWCSSSMSIFCSLYELDLSIDQQKAIIKHIELMH